MSVSIRRLRPSEFSLNVVPLVDLYIAAMEYDPAVRDSRIISWRNDIYHPGFTALIAETPGGVVGVAYGFLGSRETWWDRQLRLALQHHGEAVDNAEEILGSYFEVAEIHVTPALQRRGIGRSLLTELLWNIPAKWALLSTPEVKDEANNAFSLYRSMGFQDIVRRFRYPGDRRPFAILGKNLIASSSVAGHTPGS